MAKRLLMGTRQQTAQFMKTRTKFNYRVQVKSQSSAAFSIVEATVGMGVIGTITVALFSGFSSGLLTMQMARENLRATQIMLERTETLRLYSWDQIQALPTRITDVERYDPNATNGSQGLTYTVEVVIAPVPLHTTYSGDMKMVTVNLNWKTGQIDRNRSFTTFIARNGLQNYIY